MDTKGSKEVEITRLDSYRRIDTSLTSCWIFEKEKHERKKKYLPVSPDPKGLIGLKCFNPICSPLSMIYKNMVT
jgi:hypothetical protein